jgi:hypothetical protein
LLWSHPSLYSTILQIIQENGETEANWKVEEEIPLSRLWISGNNVNEFLTQFLRPPDLPFLNNFQTKLNIEKQFSSEEENRKRFAFFQHSLQVKQRLKNVWKSGNVLSLLVQDPRTIKFNSSSSSPSSPSQLLECPKSFQWLKRAAESICWEKQFLQQLEPQIPTNKAINQSFHSQKFMKWNQITNKAKQLFVNPSTITHISDSKDKRNNNPGDLSVNSSTENNSFQSVIPILLIHHQQQQQSRQSSSFAAESNTNNKPFFNHFNETPAALQSSFVLIVPTSYLKILWNEIFLNRKKEMINLGVEEMSFIHRLKRELYFPNDYLNTSAGWNHWEKEIFEKKLLKKELLKPKNKRTNLNNFSIKRFPDLLLRSFSDLAMTNSNNDDDDEEEEEEVYIMNEEGTGNEQETDDTNQQEEEKDGNRNENSSTVLEELQPGSEQEKEKPFHERFQIVYERNYYSEVIPPKYIPVAVFSSSHDSFEHHNANSSELKTVGGGISHCLQHRDWSLPSFEKNEFIPLLPPVSLPTFIYISLVPHSRGLPRAGAFLYLPTREEIEEFIKYQIHTKLLFSNTESPSSLSSTTELNRDYVGKWKGIYQKKNNQEKERVFLGMVVNGFHPRTNTRIGSSHFSSAMALVNINLLNAFIAEYYGRYSHPLSHLMILFQNDQSQWMRPAIYDFL